MKMSGELFLKPCHHLTHEALAPVLRTLGDQRQKPYSQLVPPNKETEDDTPYSKTHFVTKIWKFVFVQGLFITYQETFISDGTYNT